MNYKIVATGKIEVKSCSPDRKIVIQNREVIEEIWQQALKESGGKLFNDTLLNFVGLEKKGNEIEIKGSFVEYKHFLAQKKNPKLNLDIKPIGVSGITILKEANKDYVIFAQRTDATTEYPGFFELVPSGGIDKECDVNGNGTIDYKSKLLAELEEETGLSRDCVRDITEFALVLDTADNVYDICCKILIDIERAAVISKFQSSKEYQPPVFVALDELPHFIQGNINTIVPTSLALVEVFRGDSNYE